MGSLKTLTTLPALVVSEIEGEPRVLDTALAEQLGFERPRAIRQLIERNEEELQAYGPLATRHGESRGQDFTSYYLNREQALLICILSKTPKAKEVRAEVIRVFTAWTRWSQNLASGCHTRCIGLNGWIPWLRL